VENREETYLRSKPYELRRGGIFSFQAQAARSRPAKHNITMPCWPRPRERSERATRHSPPHDLNKRAPLDPHPARSSFNPSGARRKPSVFLFRNL
jgi:hypothetical protein